MGAYRAAVVTADGQNLIAQALADNKALEFTCAKTSGYVYPTGTNITGLTGLQDVEQSVMPFASQVLNDNIAQISVRFDNDDVTRQYPINTIGLYAKAGDGEERLFSVIQAINPDIMPERSDVSPSAFIYNIQHMVQNAAQITITVNPAGTATVQDIFNIEKEISAIRQDITSLENPEFEDYSEEEAEVPDASTAIEGIQSKQSIFKVFSFIKAAILGLNRDKVDTAGGDIANTEVSEFSAETGQFPVPAPGEAPKTLFGKVKKFIEDFKAWYTGVCLIGHIVNNCTSTAANMPLSAAQGRALMQLYTQLNSDLSKRATLGANTYTDPQTIVGASFGIGTPNLTLTAMTSQNQHSRPTLVMICDAQAIYSAIWMDIDGTLKYSIGDAVYTFALNRIS